MSADLHMNRSQAVVTKIDSQLLYDAFNASPIGIAVENLDGQPIFLNPAFCSFLGFSEEELRNKHCVDFSPPEDAQKDWALFQQLRAGSIDHYQMEKRYFRKDGSLIWGRLTISLLNHRPSPLVLAMVDDITEKKTAEEALRDSEERLRLAAQVGKMYAYSWDVATDDVVRSPEYASILGISSGRHITRRQFSEQVHPDDRARFIAAVITLTPSNPSSHLTYRVLRPDGSLIWLEKNARAFFDSQGKMLRMIGMVADITERKLAEQELARANEQFKLSMEAAGIGGWEFDLSSRQNLWFGKAHVQLGMKPDEGSSSQAFWARVHPDDYAVLRNALQAAKRDHTDFNHEFRVVWADGTIHWLHSRGRYHYSATGEAERMLGMSIDITDRKCAEEAHYRHAAIVESSEDAIISVTVDGIIVTWNAGAQHIYGYTEAEAVGKAMTILVPPELMKEENSILERLRAGERIEHFETIRLTKAGKRINVSLTLSPVKDTTGTVIGSSGIARDITERKRNEEALRKSEERFRLAALAGKMFAYEWDVVTDVIVRSPEAAKILGIDDAAQVTGQQVLAKVHPDDRGRLLAAIAALSRERPELAISYRLTRPDGTVIWVERNSRAHFDEQGKVLRMIGMVADITERKCAEQALKKSEEKFSKAFRDSPMALTLTSAKDHRYLDVNETFERITGWRRGEVIGRTPFDIGIWVDPTERMQFVNRLLTDGVVRNLEVRFRRKDGVAMVGLGSAELIEIENEPCILSVIADITERKLAEDRLREYEKAVEGAEEMIAVVDREYRYLIANRKFLNMRNMSKEQVVGHFVHEVLSEGVFESVVKQKLDECFEGKIVRYELKYSYPALGERHVLMSYFPIEGATGIDRVACILQDITERKQAEEALKESEGRFRLVADTAPVMIWMSGLDKKPTYFNQLWQDFTGLSETDLKHGLAGIVHPEDYGKCHDIYCRGFDQRQSFRKECRLRRHDGQYRWMLDIGVPRFHKDGSFAGYIGSCIDVTERKQAEEAFSSMTRKLIEAQEQERARIARELHDDVSQRLAILTIELEQLERNPSEVRSGLQELRKKTAEIASDVQALSHELHSSKLEYLGAVAGIRGWCKEFSERQGVEISFRSDVSQSLPLEIGLCLFRVVQEALNNSLKHSGVKQIELQLAQQANEVHLTISDSGRGFDFEAAMQGQGLGLTSMRERVRLVNGSISVNTKPMSGTTIHVVVPVPLSDAQRAAV
jgi:PAS domain S-box-containing protein